MKNFFNINTKQKEKKWEDLNLQSVACQKNTIKRQMSKWKWIWSIRKTNEKFKNVLTIEKAMRGKLTPQKINEQQNQTAKSQKKCKWVILKWMFLYTRYNYLWFLLILNFQNWSYCLFLNMWSPQQCLIGPVVYTCPKGNQFIGFVELLYFFLRNLN